MPLKSEARAQPPYQRGRTQAGQMPTTRQIETSTTVEGISVSCEQPTVYYDGSCPLCSTEVSFYRKREGAQTITFVDVSDAEQRTNLGDLDSEQAMRRFHVRDANGTLHSGARGFFLLWRQLPAFRWLGYLGRLPGVTSLAEGLYRLFLKVRPTLSAMMRRRATGA